MIVIDAFGAYTCDQVYPDYESAVTDLFQNAHYLGNGEEVRILNDDGGLEGLAVRNGQMLMLMDVTQCGFRVEVINER